MEVCPQILACAAFIVAVALMVQLVAYLYKLRIVILNEKKGSIVERPFLLDELNNLGKVLIRFRKFGLLKLANSNQ